MNKLLALIFIASVFASCCDDCADTLAPTNNFMGSQIYSLSDTAWVYDSINHVYTAKVHAGILDDYAVSHHYVVKIYYYVNNITAYRLPYTIDSVLYTATYKALELDLTATPASDTIPPSSLWSKFIVYLYK